MSIGDKSGKNIMSYSNYITNIINDDEINKLISLLDKKEQKEIKSFWSVLSTYNDNAQTFENIFLKSLEQSYFDYSLIGVSLLEQPNKQQYIQECFKCPQSEMKILFSIPQFDDKTNMISRKLVYSRYPSYGMGVYFTRKLDSISFNSGIYNIVNNIPINITFDFIGAEGEKWSSYH